MFTSDSDMQRADWPLLQGGAVTLFWRPQYLDETRQALAALDYDIVEVSGRSGWTEFAEQMSAALRWEEQFGYSPWTGNLNAFNDGLSGFPFGGSNRSALIIRDFDKLVEEHAEASRGLLDVLEVGARDHLLWGRTLVVLVQTHDNHYHSGPLGGRSARWNSKEWLDASRGL